MPSTDSEKSPPKNDGALTADEIDALLSGENASPHLKYTGDFVNDDETKSFIEQAADIIHKTYEFRMKAKREGMHISNFGNCDIRSAEEGSAPESINEYDDAAYRLKMLQGEAVWAIREAVNPRLFLLLLFSHLDNSELDAVEKLLSEFEIFKDFGFEDGLVSTDEEKREAIGQDEFIAQLACIVRRAYNLDKKAKTKGLLALEEDLLYDKQKLWLRDIFISGLRLTVDGTDEEYINRILSNKIAQERDERVKRLKTIEKEAVLCIQRAEHYRRFLFYVVSRIDDSELETLREALSDTVLTGDEVVQLLKAIKESDAEPASR